MKNLLIVALVLMLAVPAFGGFVEQEAAVSAAYAAMRNSRTVETETAHKAVVKARLAFVQAEFRKATTKEEVIAVYEQCKVLSGSAFNFALRGRHKNAPEFYRVAMQELLDEKVTDAARYNSRHLNMAAYWYGLDISKYAVRSLLEYAPRSRVGVKCINRLVSSQPKEERMGVLCNMFKAGKHYRLGRLAVRAKLDVLGTSYVGSALLSPDTDVAREYLEPVRKLLALGQNDPETAVESEQMLKALIVQYDALEMKR